MAGEGGEINEEKTRIKNCDTLVYTDVPVGTSVEFAGGGSGYF